MSTVLFIFLTLFLLISPSVCDCIGKLNCNVQCKTSGGIYQQCGTQPCYFGGTPSYPSYSFYCTGKCPGIPDNSILDISCKVSCSNTCAFERGSCTINTVISEIPDLPQQWTCYH
ncbi:hypothetical protein F8M41_018568 [Gigaspora margarita]|uniref:Uncharacterized protein n=1 Tax=Gigaspora margarita TaxID=4874 RepID=A0A8H4EL88_GIGMA|nr:hypothetical protein F8M41_018568 [Gigaspora margarita]